MSLRDAGVRDRMDAQVPALGEGDPRAAHQALLGASTLSSVGREGPRPSAEGEEAVMDTWLLHKTGV